MLRRLSGAASTYCDSHPCKSNYACESYHDFTIPDILCYLFSFADPLSLVRDHRLKELLSAEGITVRTYNADLLYVPWEVNDDEGRPFSTFAEFWNKCLSMPYDPAAPVLPPKRITSGILLPSLL